MTGAKVLVADDDEDIRDLVRVLLERDGHEVRGAADGAEALRLLYAERPDVLLLDVDMPGLDGWTVLGRVRELSDVPGAHAHGEELGARQGARPARRRRRLRRQALRARGALGAGRRGPAAPRCPGRGGATGAADLPDVYADGLLTVDHRQRTALAGGTDLHLTPREFAPARGVRPPSRPGAQRRAARRARVGRPVDRARPGQGRRRPSAAQARGGGRRRPDRDGAGLRLPVPPGGRRRPAAPTSSLAARMDALQAIVLGIVQGLTEFLPISSTAHLRIVPAFFGWEDPGAAFTAVVQLGTMLAVLVYFRRELWAIARGWVAGLRDPALRAHGGVPARLVPHPGHDPDRRARARLQGHDRARVPRPRAHRRGDDPLQRRAARGRAPRAPAPVARGLHPARRRAHRLRAGARARPRASAARAPRSRPGCCSDFDRTTAARYSFLLSVPAVVLSGLFELRHVGDGGGAAGRRHGARHAPRLRRRIRVDRLAAALGRAPRHRDLRDLPDGRRRARARCSPRRTSSASQLARQARGQRLEQRAPRSG